MMCLYTNQPGTVAHQHQRRVNIERLRFFTSGVREWSVGFSLRRKTSGDPTVGTHLRAFSTDLTLRLTLRWAADMPTPYGS